MIILESLGLYIHIPFCHAKCHYCDFAAFTGRAHESSRYLACLQKELSSYKPCSLKTLFFGGGTPTAMAEDQWKKLFDYLHNRFQLDASSEITSECNPESSSFRKLKVMKELGINRLSFGLQSTDNDLLKKLGRLHDFNGFKKAYQQAREIGFTNINIDLMYGLPGQDLSSWKKTVETVMEFAPEHISAYALTVEKGTLFHQASVKTKGDFQAEMYEVASHLLKNAGYIHYEISNFAKPGCECAHNLRYWKNQTVLAAGVSAASYKDGRRWKNTEDLTEYMKRVENKGSAAVEEEILTPEEKAGEDLMLQLRLKEGVSLSPFTEHLYGKILKRHASNGLLLFDQKDQRWRPTLQGWLLSNQIFQDLLTPQENYVSI